VFTNLLTNAAKYTSRGGAIVVGVTRRGGRAIVSVRDNGIGIPESYLESVFDMFTQVNRSERRTQGGLGIGLTLVRSLVAMHGGQVEARSRGPDTGSEFIVELPVISGQDPAQPAPDLPLRFAPCRIMVVDDNSDAAETLGALLSALGAVVSVMHDGPSAIAALDDFGPEVVLLDIGMPRMDGYEVSRRIRATTRHAGVLLIALTGWGQEQDRRRSREAGFDHHLVKPPDVGRLHQLIRAVRPGAHRREEGAA
jgi:CheY-like chemotaxis protein